MRQPQLGELVLDHVVLQVADNPEHKLVTFAPNPRDERRLASLIASGNFKLGCALLGRGVRPVSGDPCTR